MPSQKKPRAARRVALSLPADLIEKLEAVARARRLTVDRVAETYLRRALGSEFFQPGMGKENLAALERAFEGLSEDEMLAVDGILATEPR